MNALKVFLIALILSALFISAGSVNRSYKRALRYYEKGEISKALEKVNLSLKQSKSKEAMWLKGYILVRMKSYARAISFLEYKLPPGNAPDVNLTARGDCYFALDNYERALYHYKKVRSLGLEELQNLGATYFYLNHNDSALYFLDKVVALTPNRAVSYYARAMVYRDEMRMDLACRDLQKACDLGSQAGCTKLEKDNCLSWKHVWSK